MLQKIEEFLGKYPNFYQIFLPIIITIISSFLALFLLKIPQKYIQKHKKIDFLFKKRQFLQNTVYLKRELEIQEIIQELIKVQKLTIVYGAVGRGKTIMLKKLHDIIIDKNEKFFHFSLYIDLDKKNLLEELEKVSELKISSPLDFYNWIKSLLGRKKCLIILDNIAQAQYTDVINFFLDNYHNRYKIIMGLNYINPNESSRIEIKNFNTKQVAELAKLRRLDIDESNLSRVFTLTQGIPVYVDYLFKENNHLDNYELMDVISSQLANCSSAEKDILQIIALNKILYYDFTKNLFSSFGTDLIMSLSSRGLIQFDTTTNCIKLNSLIAEQYLSHLKNEEVYKKLSNYYKIHSKENFLELSLLQLITIHEEDYPIFLKILEMLYSKEEYQYLLYLGETILHKDVQPLFDFNIIIDHFFNYFISSLLKVGDYNYANDIIAKIDNNSIFDSELTYRNIKAEAISYRINYCDLLHLTNSFQESIDNLELLIETSRLTIDQKERCEYLILHCKRHIGNDLSNVSNEFYTLYDSSQNVYFKIRSLYSAFSINMFQGKKQIKENFEDMKNIIDNLNPNNEVLLFAQRHYAIYYRKFCGDLDKAESLLIQNIKDLESSKLRILYDYYFEAGELYRERFHTHPSQKTYKTSFEFYEKAIEFSKNVGDTNLYHNAMIGRILLQAQGFQITQEDLDFILQACETESILNKVQFQLVYYYLSRDYKILKKLSDYANKLGYYSTSAIANKLSEKQLCFIPLTVM